MIDSKISPGPQNHQDKDRFGAEELQLPFQAIIKALLRKIASLCMLIKSFLLQTTVNGPNQPKVASLCQGAAATA